MNTVDIVSNWVYEQINVDFYEVVKTTAKTIMLVALRREKRGRIIAIQRNAHFQKRVRCSFRRKSIEYGGETFCNISSFESARLWKGEPEIGTNCA